MNPAFSLPVLGDARLTLLRGSATYRSVDDAGD
jgi:hypothetical protein